MNLNQITLPVTDMPAATRFYRALGCLHIVDTPHYARFESPAGEATFSLSLATSASTRGVVIYFEVDDVDQTWRELCAKGIVFEESPDDKTWLWREATTRDPSGNAIKIYHAGSNRRYPPWRVERSD